MSDFLRQFHFTVNTDRMANSADPDQNDSMLKSHRSNSRIITVFFLVSKISKSR